MAKSRPPITARPSGAFWPGSIAIGVSEWPLLGRYNYLSDWPESQSSQFHMRPGKRNADHGNGKRSMSSLVSPMMDSGIQKKTQTFPMCRGNNPTPRQYITY